MCKFNMTVSKTGCRLDRLALFYGNDTATGTVLAGRLPMSVFALGLS